MLLLQNALGVHERCTDEKRVCISALPMRRKHDVLVVISVQKVNVFLRNTFDNVDFLSPI